MIEEKTNYERWLAGQLADPAFQQGYERSLEYLRLGSQLAQRREALGLTQAQLARRVGVKRDDIDRIEMADYEEPPLALIGKVAEALQLRLAVRMELIEEKTAKIA